MQNSVYTANCCLSSRISVCCHTFAASCCASASSVCISEDSFDTGKHVFVNTGEETIIPAYTPVILQLSCTNSEQALKGNCLKLRRVMPLRSYSRSSWTI